MVQILLGATHPLEFGATHPLEFGATHPPEFGATHPLEFGATHPPEFFSGFVRTQRSQEVGAYDYYRATLAGCS